jgi:hypothetical protein
LNSIKPKNVRPRLAKPGRSSVRDAIGTIRPGHRVIGITDGSFSMIDMIVEVCRQVGPADLYISTWTTSEKDLTTAIRMIESGRVRRFVMLVDRSVKQLGFDTFDELSRRSGGRIVKTRTHAKFAVIRNGRLNVTIRSSMNLNRNKRIEQFDLDESKEIADYFVDFVDGASGRAMSKIPPRLSADLAPSDLDELLSDAISLLEEEF